jgi:hypothetical protein
MNLINTAKIIAARIRFPKRPPTVVSVPDAFTVERIIADFGMAQVPAPMGGAGLEPATSRV